MNCPKCNNADTKVIDSRVVDNGQTIRRRRECEYCQTRFTTFEKRGYTELMVIKRDGTKEMYDKAKLKKAILLSFAKRPVDQEVINTMIATLETEWSLQGNDVTSEQIGADVLEQLKTIDPIAYVRFASVYKSFASLEQFASLLQS
ncbi:MAG: transcriptional repressor NrdR [Candidatus Peribacteria bacterium]|nr:MAG: transcriptional repressor NrdR [Candidatus Peribacteria bacterium]